MGLTMGPTAMPEAPARGFSAAEHRRRTAAAQRAMETAGIDALLLMSEAELRYFTGFFTPFWQSPTRPWFLILPASGAPIAVIPEIGAAPMRRTWLSDIRTWPAPRPADDGVSLLIEALTPLLAGRGRLGLLKGPETGLRMPLADYERLLAALPDVRTVDATPLIRRLRAIKSPAEIEKIAHIAAIASDGFDALAGTLAVGQPLDRVFRDFRRALLQLGADEVPYLVGGAGPGGYHDVISPPGARPLAPGDVLMLDTGATFDGYFCDFDRNFAIGPASDAARRAHDRLWRATEAGLAAARPGVPCHAVFHAMRTALGADAAGDIGRFGHGLGMHLTEPPSIAVFDDTRLEENMVLTLEPSLGYGDGRIMVHEENIVVGPNGPRLLTRRAPPDLPQV